MMINPMMYRVFLRDEKDTPDSRENPENTFRIQFGKILAWYYDCHPGYKPSLDAQLRQIGCGGILIGPLPEMIDGHRVICYDECPIGVVHDELELAQRSYDLAVQYAREMTRNLSTATGNHYEFIDVTSRGDWTEAKGLAAIVVNETLDDSSPRAADIGD